MGPDRMPARPHEICWLLQFIHSQSLITRRQSGDGAGWHQSRERKVREPALWHAFVLTDIEFPIVARRHDEHTDMGARFIQFRCFSSMMRPQAAAPLKEQLSSILFFQHPSLLWLVPERTRPAAAVWQGVEALYVCQHRYTFHLHHV